MPKIKPVKNFDKTLADIIDRGITGADIARNPGKNLGFALAIQQISERKPSDQPRILKGTGFIEDFISATQQIKQEFITSETELLFGSQNILSSTIPGQVGNKPSSEQLAEIEARFRTPLQIATTKKSKLPLRPSGPDPLRSAPPTIISGQRQQRSPRRPGRAGRERPTILTSDQDAGGTVGPGRGGRTLLG